MGSFHHCTCALLNPADGPEQTSSHSVFEHCQVDPWTDSSAGHGACYKMC